MGSGVPTSTGVPGPSVQGNGPSSPGVNPGLPVAVIVGVVCGILGFFIIVRCITYSRKRRAKARREGEVDAPSGVRDEDMKGKRRHNKLEKLRASIIFDKSDDKFYIPIS
jgi:hypothetical protein